MVSPPTEREDGESLRPVLRRATEEGKEAASRCCHRAGGALEEARRQVARLGLPMKLLGAEYNLDGGRLTLYFSAEGRVDFRDLVRELASVFRARIEMRQVGPGTSLKSWAALVSAARSCAATAGSPSSPLSPSAWPRSRTWPSTR